jgi:prepilin-type N-terminal cleavage/methylation domain-containing protein
MSRTRQRGFSLIELMVVLAILTLVMGVVFTTIANVQRRSQTEAQRVDVTQGSREFIDQLERDLRNVGYPNLRMFGSAAGLTLNSFNVAAGVVAASATDIWFEGDIDGTGNVSSVRYQLVADASGNCPCTLQRSAVTKLTGAWSSQSLSYASELGNVVNSIGGGSPWTITGTAPNGTANDTLYAGYKALPVFQFFDSNNNAITVPNTLGDATSLSSGHTAAASVAYIVVTINALGPIADQQTGLRPTSTMRTAVKVNNL